MSGIQAINLMHMPLPKATTIERIRAEANDDLLKNNKYSQGKKEYLDTNTLRRMLNEAFDYKWTWEILSFEARNDGGSEYALVYGRLHLPGLGFRDAFGAAKIESGGKKDNSAIFASASSYAFKNAVKQTGFASNLFDDNYEEELWFDERDFDKEDREAQQAQAKAESKKEEQRDSRMIIQEEASEDETVARGSVEKQKLSKAEDDKTEAPAKEAEEFTDEQKKDLADIRKDYGIKTQKQLIGFFQIWSKDIKTMEDITPRAVDDFFDFYDANADLFEDFDPQEVD